MAEEEHKKGKLKITHNCGSCRYWSGTGGGGGFCEHPKIKHPFFMVSCEGINCNGYKEQTNG